MKSPLFSLSISLALASLSLKVDAAPLKAVPSSMKSLSLSPTLGLKYDTHKWNFHEMSSLSDRVIPTLELKADPSLRIHIDSSVDAVAPKGFRGHVDADKMIRDLCAQRKAGYQTIAKMRHVSVRLVASKNARPVCLVEMPSGSRWMRQYIFVSLFKKAQLKRSYALHALTVDVAPKTLKKHESELAQVIAQVGAR